MFWLKFLVAVIFTEAVVEISIESFLLARFRAWLAGKGELWKEFSTCGYCQSVWGGIFASYLLWLEEFNFGWPEPLLWGIVVHRMSNFWHEFLSRWFGRLPWRVFLHGGRQERPPESIGKPVDVAVGSMGVGGHEEVPGDRGDSQPGVLEGHRDSGLGGEGAEKA